MLLSLLGARTHVTTLLQFLIHTYFGRLSSVLIVYDAHSSDRSVLQTEYLDAVQQSFRNLSQQGRIIGLRWIDVSQLDNGGGDNETALEQQILRAVNIVTEGFITILPDTQRFLHARYYATRYAKLRLKDKFYLFLCEHENPQDFLATEILQFYPHHLLVVPATPTKQIVNITTTTTQKLKEKTPNKPKTALNHDVAQSCVVPRVTNVYKSYAVNAENVENDRNVCGVETAQGDSGEWRWCAHRDINFQMWTQKFVGATGNLNAMLLDAFRPNETFERNVELFPNKVWNLQGRTVRVGSITYIPYVVTNYVPPGSGNSDPIDSNDGNLTVSYLGSEAELVKTFCEVRNCHLRVEAYGVDNWGYIYENESSAGMMGDVYTQRVELAIGCIYNWYNNITETSHTIARSAVTVLGPAPAQFPAWRTNIMPFSSELWTFLITTMFLCACVMYCIKLSAFTLHNLRNRMERKFRHVEAFEGSMLDIIAVFIQQPSAETSLRTFAARFFLTTILCATITLENTYSGQLKSILTVPLFTEAVDTIEKWSHTDWSWGAPSIVWVQTVENSNLIKEQIMTQKFKIRDYNYLYNASFRYDYGLGIERLMSGTFSFGDFITAPALETKIIPKDDLYFDWTRAISIRGWPLMPLFNKHVLACMETGLFIHWERQIVAQYLDRQIQEIMLNLASGHTNKMPPKKLTFENISGATFALLFGHIIAIFILIVELVVFYMQKLKR